MKTRLIFCSVMLLCALRAEAHLCDNVFRQADKLIVKPETYNLIVKDEIDFKIFLQNNMDRGIAEIALQADSKAFDFEIKPKVMSIPKDQRAYFQVTMKAKPETRTGNYPVSFRLVGGGRVFKTFSMQAGGSPAKPEDGKSAGKPAVTGANAPARALPSAAEAALSAKSAAETPAIDGALNDKAWKGAAVLSNFSSSNGGRAKFDTAGLFTFDNQGLCFGFLCHDDKVDDPAEGDFIEISLAFARPAVPCYILRISPGGKVMLKKRLADGRLADWTGTNIRFALGKAKKAWTAEVSIPFAAFDDQPQAAGRKVYLRLTRSKSTGFAEQSYWAAGPGGYNMENEFGEISLIP